ncbi:hypothetical protein VTN02DRAFT_2860 [Thermoascus thermophilus]
MAEETAAPSATAADAAAPAPSTPGHVYHPNVYLPELEIDTEVTDNDSTYGNELSAYSASITASVVDYKVENGRRYHAYREGRYMFPNDEDEQDRLDMMHAMFSHMMHGKIFLAPIGPNPGRVIDVGTGTGIWAIDFADTFPSAEVIGNDLSPIQPSLVPPNVKFVVDDFLEEWGYEDTPFNFVHARFLAAAIKTDDFVKLIKHAYKNTAPGGWVEFQDWDIMIRSDDGSTKGTAIEQYYIHIVGAFERQGYEPRPGPKFKGWLEEAGFVDVHVQKYRIPMGTWPKDKYYKTLGTWNLMQAEAGFEGSAMAVLTRYANWSKEEVSVLAAKTKNDARNRSIHPVFDFYVVYGRKPEN